MTRRRFATVATAAALLPGLPLVTRAQEPTQAYLLVQQYWIGDKPCYIKITDLESGEAIFQNERGDETRGKISGNTVSAFSMDAPVLTKEGTISIQWPKGPGYWARTDLAERGWYIEKPGKALPCKVVPLPNFEYDFYNEWYDPVKDPENKAHNRARGRFTSATTMHVDEWNLDVTVGQDSLVFSNLTCWRRVLPRG